MPRSENYDSNRRYGRSYDQDQDHRQYDQSRRGHKPHNKPEAFIMWPDHVPMLLHLDLLATLSEFIFTHGSDNTALMAFAHKCRSMCSEDGSEDGQSR